MTHDRFERLYNALRSAAHAPVAVQHANALAGKDRVAQALDLLIMETDSVQAGMVDWAMDNGYPEFRIIEQYGVTKP